VFKEIRIIYSSVVKDELINLFEREKIDKYINFEGLETVWGEKVKRLNNHIWPGTDNMLVLIIENAKAQELISKLKIIKENLKDGIELFILVSPIEEII